MSIHDGLLPEEYQVVVAPAMQAAAELAAARGDPYLFNDIACMLTLMVLVRDLGDLYQDQWGALGQTSPAATFAAAPIAAVVMVLNEYDLDDESVNSMSAALQRAYTQLSAADVFGPERVQVQLAWSARQADKLPSAAAYMRQAATQTATAIDAWEAARTQTVN